MAKTHPYYPDHTLAAFDMVLSHIKKLCRAIDVAVSTFFIFLYIYSIFTNLENPILLAINSILLVVSLSFFVLHAIGFTNKSKAYDRVVNHHIGRAVRYFKMLLKLFTLGLSAYELCAVHYSDLKLIFLIVAAVAFLAQILFEILRFLAERYFTILKTGISMDVDELKASPAVKTIEKIVDTAKNPTASIAEAITKTIRTRLDGEPTEGASEKKEDKWELKIKKHTTEMAAEKSIEREIRNAEEKASKKERSDSAIRELGESLKDFFSRSKR